MFPYRTVSAGLTYINGRFAAIASEGVDARHILTEYSFPTVYISTRHGKSKIPARPVGSKVCIVIWTSCVKKLLAA